MSTLSGNEPAVRAVVLAHNALQFERAQTPLERAQAGVRDAWTLLEDLGLEDLQIVAAKLAEIVMVATVSFAKATGSDKPYATAESILDEWLALKLSEATKGGDQE